MKNSQVEDNQWKLERNTKANLKHHNNVEVITCLINGSCKLLRLANHPTNCSVQNDKVTEQHTQEEQGNHSGYGRNNPLALFSVKGRQEKCHNLPDDNRCTDNHREEKSHLKPDTKATKNRDNRKFTVG